MIYLAATDLDGTLFRYHSVPPDDFWDVVEAMNRKGCTLAIASGRSYGPLADLFGENADKLSYICDNGACVVHNGKIIHESIFERELVDALSDALLAINKNRVGQDRMEIILCGKNGTYSLDRGDNATEGLARYYDTRTDTEKLTAVEDVIYKFAVFDPLDPTTGTVAALQAQFDCFTYQVSGKHSLDIMKKGTDKGVGLQMLAKIKGVAKEEIAVFGDYFNDLALFDAAGMSFCMENGHPDVKMKADYIAPSCKDDGVTELLKRLCELIPKSDGRVTHPADRLMQVHRNKAGGEGHVDIEPLLNDAQKNGTTKLFARVSIPRGSSLGYHEHHGETESYYILSGVGEYNDNGKTVKVKAGDVTHTPDGCGHGIVNIGDTDLIFIAFIQKS